MDNHGPTLTEEDQLIKNKIFLKLFPACPMASVLLKLPEETIVAINPAFETMLGCTSAEVIGKSISELDILANSKEMEHLSQMLLENDKVTNYETEIKNKIGKKQQVVFTSQLIEDFDKKYSHIKVSDISHLKQKEDSLNKTKDLLSETEAMANVGGWNFNMDSLKTYWTDGIRLIYEVDSNFNATFESAINFYTPESRPIIEKAVQRAMEFGESFDLELEIITAKGNRKSVHTIGHADFENRRVYGFFQDITKQKEAERLLIKNKILLSETESVGNVGGWEFNIDTLKTYWTDGVSAIHEVELDYNPNIESGINFYTPESRPIIEKAVQRAIEFGESFDLELEIITAKGNRKSVHTIGHADIENRRVYGFFQDINKQKETERLLIKNKMLLSETESIAKIGGWNINMENMEIKWTEGVRLLHEVDNTFNPTIESGINFYTPESKPIIKKAVQRAIEFGEAYDLELEIKTAKGNIKQIRTFAHVDAKKRTLSGFIQDISQKKKAELEIKKLNQELEQRVKDRTAQLLLANEELEAFTYSVSHDLRAPIRHINGFSDILITKHSDQLAEEPVKYLNAIKTSANKMGELIDDLLRLSRTGRTELHKTVINMNKVVEESRVQAISALKDRKIEWDISSLPDIRVDYNLLAIVWVNLIDNALKYSAHNEKTIIQIGYKEEESEIIYYIKDNGSGFNMKYADKLFGVFQRLHSSSQFEGTGIGLANIKRIIIRHGGKVWAEAEVNKGATFYFSIPKSD